jgi:hypothetical protein
MNAPINPYDERRIRYGGLVLVACEEAGPEYGASDDDAATAMAPETISDWTVVHAHMTRLGRARAAHERELCRWLLAAERLAVHARAGYASLAEYAERTLGLKDRQTEERLRVGHALTELPLLDRALAAGELCWSAARELTRMVTRETEAEWLAWATGRRSREIERAVAARLKGDRPGDEEDPSLLRHTLRFEVRAETMALFRDLQARVRADLGALGAGDAGRALDDDTLLYEMARRALSGPGDEGRASYQVALTTCASCGRSSVDAGGQSYPVDDDVADMMACDMQHLGNVDRVKERRDERPDEWPEEHTSNASPHMGAGNASPAPRATQTLAPAIRRLVMRRDRRRCVVAGCKNHVYLDVHHIDPKAEGGGHDPERILALCGAHHRAVHRGALRIDGSASAGFSFHHADGTPYGQPISAPAVDVANQVFSALRHMGFKETEARARIDRVRRAAGPLLALEDFLRAALHAL